MQDAMKLFLSQCKKDSGEESSNAFEKILVLYALGITNGISSSDQKLIENGLPEETQKTIDSASAQNYSDFLQYLKVL
jgi:hypothetical protein